MKLKKFLFENEAVVGINSPSQYLYIKIVRFVLAIVGAWPKKEIGEPEPRYQTIMINTFYFGVVNAALFGSITYVYFHNSELSFLEVGHMYIVILMSAVDVKYRDLAKEFLTKLHLFYFKDRSPYAILTHKKVHLICHLFSLWLLSQMLTGLSLFNLIPMYTNYSSGRYASGGTQNATFEHSLYFPYPFNTSTDINGYIVACILHWLLSYFCATWFCMFDLFLSIMVFHLWGHFKILINSLDNFPKPSTQVSCTLEGGFIVNAEKFSKEELVKVSRQLKECIDYHREIIHRTVESEKLKHAVYGLPWECMDANNRKVVAFFLMNVQEPVHIKALGVANVGVTSMAAILKTSMSYFTFLRSM
ncbi:hypothetical protein HF086_010926 [Spodoptera exigua]|uniref:Odorant receptor n=1 Tax=Spodoptera exigua TaxID=7107 RepID=A0A922MJD9_SPOEX|nr:hypothetical protein HF086_010926 [Spodoptera exigua]